MEINSKPKEFYIEVNDIFDELSDENKRLNNELMFANNCLNVLNKFKILLKNVFIKYETTIETKDKQNLDQLEEEFNSIIKSIEEFNTSNVKTEDNIFEIERNDENNRVLSEEQSLKTSNLLNESNERNDREVTDIRVKQINCSQNKRNENKRNLKTKSNFKPKEDNKKLNRKLETTLTLVPESEGSDPTEEEEEVIPFVQTMEQISEEIIISEITDQNNSVNQTEDLDAINVEISEEDICNESHVKKVKNNKKSNIKQKQIDCKTDPNSDSSDDTINDTNECTFIGHKSNHLIENQNEISIKTEIENVFEFNDKINEQNSESNQELIQTNESIDESVDHLDSDTDISDYSEDKETKKRKIVCNFDGCDQQFKRRYNLLAHIRYKHTFEKPFECSECQKTFVTKRDLNRHKSTTHSEGNYECDKCHKLFTRRDSLLMHIRAMHTFERPFRCNVCKKTFVRKDHLESHQKAVHSVDKYECNECHKLFSAKEYLLRHKKIHSLNRKLYSCNLCDFKSKSYYYFKRHINEKHKH